MSNFIAGFIDSGTSIKKDERLVKALIELIDIDDSIDDTQVFYMRHLLLNAIDNYDSLGLLPIFIPLKEFGESTSDLLGSVK